MLCKFYTLANMHTQNLAPTAICFPFFGLASKDFFLSLLLHKLLSLVANCVVLLFYFTSVFCLFLYPTQTLLLKLGILYTLLSSFRFTYALDSVFTLVQEQCCHALQKLFFG